MWASGVRRPQHYGLTTYSRIRRLRDKPPTSFYGLISKGKRVDGAGRLPSVSDVDGDLFPVRQREEEHLREVGHATLVNVTSPTLLCVSPSYATPNSMRPAGASITIQ